MLWLSFAAFFAPLMIILPLPKELVWLIVGLFVLGSFYLMVIGLKVLERISQLKSCL